jgi:hypothetical protein
VEGALAGELDAAARAWLARQDRRLRDRLVVPAVVTLLALAAAVGSRWRGNGSGAWPPGPAWAAVPGLARRGRTLAGRQLQLLEELARDEPDPHRRRGLAGVEHLAIRLRRTAETLLAMTAPDRPPARPDPPPWPPCCAPPSPRPSRAARASSTRPAAHRPAGSRAPWGTGSSWERPMRSR